MMAWIEERAWTHWGRVCFSAGMEDLLFRTSEIIALIQYLRRCCILQVSFRRLHSVEPSHTST